MLANLSGSTGDATAAGVAGKTSADHSRFERRLTQALQRADALSSIPSRLDSSTVASSPAEGDGVTSPTPPSSAPLIDTAATVSHSPGSDQATPGARKESAGNTSEGSAAAVQQRAMRAKDNEIAHLRRTVQELSSQLHNALTTLDQRADTSAELHSLKKACEAEAQQHENGMRHARLEMLESRVRYRSMEEQLANTYEADVHAKATELLDPHTKEVHAKNFDLLKEKMILAREVTTLRAEYEDLYEQYVRLKRETDLHGSAARQLLERSVTQKDEIASLRRQVKATEDALNTAVNEYEKKHNAEEKARQAAIQSLTRERDAARRDALRLQRELAQLRSAAGNVLAQRTELEAFFYAALEEVRQGVIEERRQQLLESRPAACAANAKSVLPAHTNSSLLRLERPERLLLTNGASPPLLTSSSLVCWTVDRKGFPKRIVAAPPHDASSSNAKSSPYADSTKESGTLVALPHAAPPYLRSSGRELSHLSSLAGDRCAVVTPSLEQNRTQGASSGGRAPFRLGTTTGREGDRALSPTPSEVFSGSDTAVMNDLPFLQKLPNAPTWRDVKRVDVSELRWVDKERVIQLLLKRIRHEGRRQATMTQRETQESVLSATKADAVAPREEWRVSAAEVSGESLIFLTQQ
ncbi:hypothetical protein LSCM1_00636 [Leishmania martiniquensis]|uniref:Uncharacterized protein n=1 Tax=Leishmania martiniquensis TaxID=1580590 RepID=A0A836GIG0_9TRYP|nr:hypothetical protein LSCM1_00636 [Leishmania martiniquensis]